MPRRLCPALHAMLMLGNSQKITTNNKRLWSIPVRKKERKRESHVLFLCFFSNLYNKICHSETHRTNREKSDIWRDISDGICLLRSNSNVAFCTAGFTRAYKKKKKKKDSLKSWASQLKKQKGGKTADPKKNRKQTSSPIEPLAFQTCSFALSYQALWPCKAGSSDFGLATDSNWDFTWYC